MELFEGLRLTFGLDHLLIHSDVKIYQVYDVPHLWKWKKIVWKITFIESFMPWFSRFALASAFVVGQAQEQSFAYILPSLDPQCINKRVKVVWKFFTEFIGISSVQVLSGVSILVRVKNSWQNVSSYNHG